MSESERVRLDKWLWAARFYKTRSAATEAVSGGKVEVNGERAKPAKLVQVGDRIHLRVGPNEYDLTVRGLGERRGSATVAQGLYEEAEESRRERERLAEQRKLAPGGFVFEEKGRPTKRDRRELERFRDKKRGR